jgi:glycosyltransferase involved in cell wall biosynthesis
LPLERIFLVPEGIVNINADGITIGIPVFNEEKHVEAAVRSAAPQCDLLLVSDNASTDRSGEICRRLAVEFRHLAYFRQPQNIGAADNFKFLLDRATTSEFMWLGAHDRLPPDYVSKLHPALNIGPDVVLAYSPTRHIDGADQTVSCYEYAFNDVLCSSAATLRLLALIRFLTDCSMIHGIFRTAALREAWIADRFIGVDHVLLSTTALLGRFVYVPDAQYYRRDVHLTDTKAAQLVRIVGGASSNFPTYSEMQRRQWALMLQATRGLGIAGIGRRCAARYFLVKRFGPFSRSPIALLGETILNNVFWLYRRTFGRLLTS